MMIEFEEEIPPTNHGARSERQEPRASRAVTDDPLNSILLLVYELSIANAPYPPADCRDIADKVAARVGEARAVVAKWKASGARVSRRLSRQGV